MSALDAERHQSAEDEDGVGMLVRGSVAGLLGAVMLAAFGLAVDWLARQPAPVIERLGAFLLAVAGFGVMVAALGRVGRP